MSDDYSNSVNISASEDIWQSTNILQSTDCQTSSHAYQIALANTTNPGKITTSFAYNYPAKLIIFLFFVAAAASVVIIIIIIIFTVIIALIRITDVAVTLRERYICRGSPSFGVFPLLLLYKFIFIFFCVGPFLSLQFFDSCPMYPFLAFVVLLPQISALCCDPLFSVSSSLKWGWYTGKISFDKQLNQWL